MGGGLVTDIRRLLQLHALDDGKVDDFLELMSWCSGSGTYLDLQYTPIIRLDGHAAILFACHLHSDLIRNLLMRSRVRMYASGQQDPISDELAEVLRLHTDKVRTHVNYNDGALSGELDVVALVDETLFIFECKNTLLPCSAFEQRVLYDHLEKASAQLERISVLLQRDDFRETFARGLRWGPGMWTSVRYVIVPSVRLFSGIDYCGFPVRHFRELVNFIRCGRGFLAYQGEFEVDFWGGQSFSGALLQEYLSPSNSVYDPVWQSTAVAARSFGTKHWTVRESVYGLKTEKYVEAVKQRSPTVALTTTSSADSDNAP